jgi:uncharacterized protein YlaN (UPF0358 family)
LERGRGLFIDIWTEILATARNGILALWQLKIPEDPALLYEEVVDTLLFVLSEYYDNIFI